MNVQGRFATLITTMSTGAEDLFTKTRQRVSQRTVPCPAGMEQNLDMVSSLSYHATWKLVFFFAGSFSQLSDWKRGAPPASVLSTAEPPIATYLGICPNTFMISRLTLSCSNWWEFVYTEYNHWWEFICTEYSHWWEFVHLFITYHFTCQHCKRSSTYYKF